MSKTKVSNWRMVNAPATIGSQFNGAVIAPAIPLLFVSLVIKLPWLNAIPLFFVVMEIFRIRKKLPTIKDAFKYIFFKYITGQYWYGFRRSAYASLTSFAGAMFIFFSLASPVYADIVVIRPPESIPNLNVVQPSESQPLPPGGEFIDNRYQIKGAGPSVELEVLLRQIVPATYSIQFKSVEIASMDINWRSTNWTLDQLLGNISMRYGVMFETMHGSSVLSVDWHDQRKCSNEENKLFKRICGQADGFY